MPAAPADRTTATAGQLQAGDRVIWLTPCSTDETAEILDVKDSAAFPGYVEITEAPDGQNRWWPGAQRTRRFPRARLVACVIAEDARAAGRPVQAPAPCLSDGPWQQGSYQRLD